MVTVNVVVLAGTVAADPVERRMPSGDEVTELRLSVPEAGRRLLPVPVAVWHKDVGKRVLNHPPGSRAQREEARFRPAGGGCLALRG